MLRSAMLSLGRRAGRTAALAGGLAAGAAFAGSTGTSFAERQPDKLPTFSKEEVAKHADADSRIWVTLGNAVYDITTFVENHPGGMDKIMSAAGGAVEPYWALYRQHVQPAAAGKGLQPKDHVAEILAPLQVGWLDPASAAAAAASRPADDPYANEPARHPALKLLSETPCSAETPTALIPDHWITPSELWYVRNHHPVPHLHGETFRLHVGGTGVAAPRDFTLDELKALPKSAVTATIQCGGNRRGGLNEVRRTAGNAWGIGAISNATWGGVLLRDVLSDCGLAAQGTWAGSKARHVIFEGEDGTVASIPVEKACSASGDVLLAYEMNGEPLSADHGYPLRVVVPGYVGVRNIKWLRQVRTSPEEADGVWQRGLAYKVFNPSVTSVSADDVAAAAPMQEMPVQSAILLPSDGSASDDDETVSVAGYAWSGGGRGIVRVDVSADAGETWHTTTLTEGARQKHGRAWAWTFWEAEVPLPPKPPGSGEQRAKTQLVCKATDAAHNTQPEQPASAWNLRGLANNTWHRVDVWY